MKPRHFIFSMVASMAVLFAGARAGASPCAGVAVRGSGIGRADIGAVQRAVVFLPAVGTRQFPMGVGALVPRDVDVKPVPAVVVKLLPQYAGYRAFRSGYALLIVNPRSRRISYRLPLRGASVDGC